MSTYLLLAIVFINLAFVFYTVGVWAERLSKRLRPWHLVCFWIGLTFDTAGTAMMERLGSFQFNFHSITGLVAILLMAVHAYWATSVIRRGDEERIRTFHRFSLFVWLVWLLPFVGGAILGANV